MKQSLWRCKYDVFEKVWKGTKTFWCKKTTVNIMTNNFLLNFFHQNCRRNIDLQLTIEVMVSTYVTRQLWHIQTFCDWPLLSKCHFDVSSSMSRFRYTVFGSHVQNSSHTWKIIGFINLQEHTYRKNRYIFILLLGILMVFVWLPG